MSLCKNKVRTSNVHNLDEQVTISAALFSLTYIFKKTFVLSLFSDKKTTVYVIYFCIFFHVIVFANKHSTESR